MGNIQVTSNSDNTGSVRHKITSLLEDMWKKIGLHHHGVDGDVVSKEKLDKVVSESDDRDRLLFQINLPDMEAPDISVEIEDDRLVVFGAHREQHKTVSEHYVSTSQTIRHFEQSFLLPEGAVAKDANASFEKGVLTLTVPRK